jgi:hypothetical protein
MEQSSQTQHRAEAAFTIGDRAETPVEWQGASVRRARWTKTFTGDLAGTSYVELILGELDARQDAPLARVYVGVERIEGVLQGRTGSFTLVHVATSLGADHDATWTILPGSGTGELAGISGTARILPNHDFVLNYDLAG